MANGTITINQFNDVLNRLDKLEYKHKEIPWIFTRTLMN